MSLKDFFKEIDLEVGAVLSSDFQIEVTETNEVPSFDDPNITYDHLDNKVKKCKRLESCVLYVDMRDSTKISAAKRPATLAKIYSSFVRSMIAAAGYYKGHVRNIIGDRVMVVFDKEHCFEKAIYTAILMNSISKHILNKRIRDIDFRCGIGIDYGKMLIAKAGAVRRGAEKEFYRSLVWLGKPANVASRLTDIANKTTTTVTEGVCQGNYYPSLDKWSWLNKKYEQFIDDLEPTFSRDLKHKNNYFSSFFKTSSTYNYTPSPILMTEAVFSGLKRENCNRQSIINNWWKEQAINVRDYDGKVFGGDIIFTAVQEI
jgi:class 3 adenylate cyclase